MVEGLDKDSTREPIFDIYMCCIDCCGIMRRYKQALDIMLSVLFFLCEMHIGGFILCE